jgi:hypothetical protein
MTSIAGTKTTSELLLIEFFVWIFDLLSFMSCITHYWLLATAWQVEDWLSESNRVFGIQHQKLYVINMLS